MSTDRGKLLRRAKLVLSGIAAAWIACAVALDAYGGRPLPPGQFDAIIVAGCRVRPDGSPSLALERRTRQAVKLWHEGRASLLVLTGGVGESRLSEAEVEARLARALGVPGEAMRLETRSRSTEEQAELAGSVVAADRVIVVTDAYHAYRCGRVFGRHFPYVEATGTVGQPYHRVKGALREVVAVVWYWMTGRL